MLESRNSSLPKKNVVFLVYLFGMYVLTFIVAFILVSFVKITNSEVDTTLLNILLNLLIYLFLFTVFIILLKRYFKEQLVHLKLNATTCIVTAVIGWFLLIAANVIVQSILEGFNFEMRDSENQELIAESLRYSLLTAVYAIALAPLVEEVVFRGVIYNFFNDLKLPKKLNVILGIFLSSTLFGLIHVLPAFLVTFDFSELILGIPYATTGLVLVLLYHYTKNIFVPILTHTIQNLISVLALLLLDYLNDFIPPDEIISTGTYIIRLLFNIG